MGQFRLYTVTAFVLFALAVNFTGALQVEFFGAKNYRDFNEGIQKKAGEDKECYDLGKSISIESVKTDKCLVLYDNDNCSRVLALTFCVDQSKCVFYSYRIEANTAQFNSDEAFTPWSSYRRVRSFHVCDEKLGGGPSLNLDYYDKAYLDNSAGKLVRKWRDVCTCQNVPKDIRGGNSHVVSINNHGNDVKVFSGENCRGESQHLPAGDNAATRRLLSFAPKFDIASFRPAGLLDCIKLDAHIFKFYFKNGTFGGEPHEEKVKLATTGEIVNDGPGETSEEYMISEKVTETVEFSIADGYKNMHHVGAELSVETKVEAGVPLLGKGEVSTKVSAKYEYTREDTSTTTNTNTVGTETTVQITKRVTVPACNTCTINGYVKQAKDFPIDYDSYSKVSGYAGAARLKAGEIKGYLPAGVDYVRDIDEFTVETITHGTMFAKFGVKTLVAVKCDPIPDCVSKSENKGPSSVYYEFPLESDEKGHLKSDYQHTNQIGTSVGSYWNSLSEAA